MKINPVSFNGSVHVTTVKNNQWFWADYETSKKADKEILKFADKIVPHKNSYTREVISKKDGKHLQSIIEKDVGEKLDIPKNACYSIKHFNQFNDSILLFATASNIDCDDRTAIDIYI